MASDFPVRLEVRLPGSRPSFHEVTSAEFLIGSVAGCDLVIPGADLPPVLGVVARATDGIRLRKLAPNFKLVLNGKAIHHAPLTHGDTIGIGNAVLQVHMPAMASTVAAPLAAAAGAPSKPWTFNIPLGGTKAGPPASRPIDTSGAMRQLQQESDRIKQQARDIEQKHKALDNEERSRRAAWAERESQLEAELDAARDRKRTAAESSRREDTARSLALDQRERQADEFKKQLDAERAALETTIRDHREDLARLDRQKADIERRELEIARREEAISRDLPLIEQQQRRLEQWESRLKLDDEAIRTGQAEADAARMKSAQRAAELETQESLAKALDMRLERMRDDLARESQTLTEQKAKQDRLDRELHLKEQHLETRTADLTNRERTLASQAQSIAEREAELKATEERISAQQHQLTQLDADLKNRESLLATARTTLESSVREHREDLARLDRFRETLENREKQVVEQAADIERKSVELQDETRQLEALAADQKAAEARLHDEHTRIEKLKSDLEANTNQLAQRSATTEGQQSILVAVRAKLERLREEVRTEAQMLADQRAKQDSLEQELNQRQKQLEERAAELDAVTLTRTKDHAEFAERRAMIDAAFAEMKSLKIKLSEQEAALAVRAAELETRGGSQAEEAGILRTKATQLLEIQQTMQADRQALAQREQALREAELARTELQEQLLRRSEDLANKQKAAEEWTANLAARAAELDRDRQSVDADVQTTRADLDARIAELEQAAAEVQAREEQLLHRMNRLKEVGQAIALERKQRAESKAQWEEEHRLAAEDLVRMRAELERFRSEVLNQTTEVQNALPDLELRGSAALDRLVHAREQLKSHVAELHDYARQSHEDLEALRGQVQNETERLRSQQSALGKARGEHRHAVTAFRQQLIDWQGRVAEMKQTMAHNDTRMQRRADELDVAAKEIESTTQQLAHHAAQLQAQEQLVSQKRGEVVYHLTDMRDWFRHKLRELAQSSAARGHFVGASDDPQILSSGLTNHGTFVDTRVPLSDNPDVIAITSDLDPGDKKLGELLQTLELVDDGTLTALLLEARRQRRSLRQVLLASGKLTVYQMALIEAGNVDGLSIGPLGVIDRLQVTPREIVYRVIDPRPGSALGPLVLRHLAESEMSDAVRPDEFRQRFAALTQLQHPHIAATVEVLDIQGRPAALQEWLSGITSAEWPSLAASPGVWFRLTCQALLGLATAHQSGLIHGALSAKSVVLTSDGLVKITGIGEPAWLTGANSDAAAADDLKALGELAVGWAAMMPKRKFAKPPRPLPPLLRQVLDRWAAGAYQSGGAILDELDRAGTQVSSGAETWDRLVRFAGENATEGVAWRKSA